MAPHSSTLAWKIPWMEKPGRLQSMGSWRVGHDWVTSLSCTGEGNGNPLQCSCLENPGDRGAWWASVYGAAQSWTQLKRLSSSRSSHSNRRKISLPWWLSGKDLSANAGDMGSVSGLGRSNAERNGNPFAWKIQFAKEPCGLQTMVLQRVGRDWVTWTTNKYLVLVSHSHFKLYFNP